MPNHPVRPVRVSTHVPAPPDQVFAFVSDTRNDPYWCHNVERVELVEGQDVAVGARFRFHQHLDRPGSERIHFDAEVEVIGLDDNSITWSVTDKFQSREISLTVEPDGSGSKITQVTKAAFRRPPGLARWVYPRLARRIFAEQFRNLAAHFEEGHRGAES
jgi:uncharacterized protein YndB with AHSA1/START domain